MKRIGSFSLAIIVFTLSIVLCFPDISFADDATTLSKSKDNPFGYSSSEAQSYVSAHKDIYDSDHILLFSYTPTNTYNWTYSQVGKNSLHLSDNQLVAFLMSKKTITAYASMFVSVLSNNNVTRGLLSSVGIATTGDSDSLVNVMDKLTGNYNYLDSLNYDEDSQTITMSNDNGSVDKLREEIKKYYYDSIGIRFIYPTDNHNPAYLIELNRSLYDYEEDYISDFNALSQYDYAVGTSYGDYTTRLISGFDKNSYSYCYLGQLGNYSYIYFLDKDMNVVNDSVIKIFNAQSYGSGNERIDLDYSFKSVVPLGSQLLLRLYSKSGDTYKEVTFYNGYTYDRAYFFSKNNKPFVYFSSYEKLFNFLNGSQTAYLSSRIDKAGEDISFSIKNMSENLGDKMDTLIDSINDKKGSMSADDLQNAIDKGIEDLNKNTEDIKDNTSSILDKLEEQNQILLQILGVTEYIAYQTTKDDGSSYTKTDLTNTINKIYNGLGNAILYGKNTLTDSGDSSGAASQSSIVTREDFKLSNNIYTSSGSGVSPGTPVVAYSLDDYSVYDDSNDYDVGIASQDINNMDIHDGLFGKFPFSVPYQLYEWLQVLQAEPEAPKLHYNYGFLLGHKNDQKYDLVIDFSIYESWANVCKSFLRLFFTLLMAVFIFRHFSNNKGGGLL